MTGFCKGALLLVAVLSMSGCALSRAQIRQADDVVAATTDRVPSCRAADRCAAPSILMDATNRALDASTVDEPIHFVSLLDDSNAALAARLSIIDAARQAVDVQTYIWEDDDAGKVVMDGLVRAARRGVRVRILIDQLGAFDNLAVLDELARASPNLTVKLYNPTFDDARTSGVQWALSIACCFLKLNQRMHNKLLVVDGKVGITGGRNYQDRYFNWDGSFDYVDRDVLVGGPAARGMAASFDAFWKHRRAVDLTHLRDLNRYIVSHPDAAPWQTPRYADPGRVARLQRDAEDPGWLQAAVVDPGLLVHDVEFFSDLPAKTDEPSMRAAAAFTRRVMELVADAKQEVVLQTPYLVISKQAGKLFRGLRRERPAPRITVSTNSLASTDAFVAHAMSYKHRKRYLKKYGFEIYELKPHAAAAVSAYLDANAGGNPHDAPASAIESRSEPAESRSRNVFGSQGRGRQPAPLLSEGIRFSVHAKSIVVDDRFAMVGSHNFDPRSDHYNTEAGVIVHDERFATLVRRSILRYTQPENAWVIAPRHEDVPIFSSVNQTIADVSARLPLFDLWPFRYATSFELDRGCRPMRITNEAFYSCYTAVGDFPDVAISARWIYTRLLTAFGSGVTGIL